LQVLEDVFGINFLNIKNNMSQISTIQYSDVLEARRFDAEYFKPEYLEIERILKVDNKTLEDFNVKIYHPNEIKREYVEKNGILFVRAQNVRPLKFDLSNKVYISKEDAEKLKKNSILKKDILMTRTGANFGQACLFNENIKAIASSHAFVIKSGNINPYLLVVFFNTKYGRNMINKGMYGGLQPEITPTFLIKIPFLNFSRSFQLQIEEIVKSAHQKQTISKKLYREAENLLLEELGLLDYAPRNTLTFETTKKEVDEATRFDAEYFQPKYEEIISYIENYDGGLDTVKNQFNQNKTLSKKKKEFYNYIEISDVDISNGEIVSNKIETKSIPANGKRKLFKNDLLISKVRPYRGAISFIDSEVENLLGSGAFTVLQEKTDYKKEVLMIFLKTVFIKELLLRYNCGTSYPVIKDEDILNLKIPLFKPEIQKQIAEKVQENHKLRKESKELLEEAKRKVEEKIEKGGGEDE